MSFVIAAAACAIASVVSGLPASAASTAFARVHRGVSPPTATRADAQTPSRTDTIAAAPITAYREAGCAHFT